MTKEKKEGSKPTRRHTAEHKAAKLAKALDDKSVPAAPGDVAMDQQAPAEQDAHVRSDDHADARVIGVKAEIARLRSALREQTAEYQRLVGASEREESRTVSLIIDMLSQESGATKAMLVTASGAKKGYVDALLSRILPARGLVIASMPVQGTRTRVYRLQRSEEGAVK